MSPINADLHNMPPTLFITSERDLLLSATSSLSRAFVRAGNQSQFYEFRYQSRQHELIDYVVLQAAATAGLHSTTTGVRASNQVRAITTLSYRN